MAVELVEWYVVMGCTVLAYYFGYSVLEYCVYTCGSFSFTTSCHFFEYFVRLDLLVHLFHVHRSGVREEVCPALHQECHCLGLGSCSEVPLPKIAEEVESQEYLDAIEEAEPEVDELAGKVAENLNINISSPDDNA